MYPIKPWIGGLCWLVLGACAAGRGDSGEKFSLEPSACVDRDKDGYGDGCASGADCDDHDPLAHSGCLRCALPSEGCVCEDGARPLSCFLEKTYAEDGTALCQEGTRYCRSGQWSGCEDVHTYPVPEPQASALIDPDAAAQRCTDCNVTCYVIRDNLDPIDGGLNGDNSGNVSWQAGGGLTLGEVFDSGVMPDAGPILPEDCILGVGEDLDCDGIPNTYDPYPNDPPFATANPTIFLGIGPGQTGIGEIDLDFHLASADIYFLVDQSGSMDGERDQLKLDLTTGDFIQNDAYDCADYDFDREPNNELKDEGVIGAIRCMIRDANFGAGLFRELPFSGYAPTNQVAFQNYIDISSDVDAVRTAIGGFETIGNNEWPEASMVALHAVLTGNGMYFGSTRRGVVPRTSCPSMSWGYPCFRDGAIPIVVLFTDAQFHNGPDNNNFAYPSTFNITAGSGDQYYPLANTNEAFASAVDLGDLTSVFKTYTGDTSAMAADMNASLSSCLSASDGKDALFRFDLTQQRSVTIESTGSHFDTVLSVFTGVPSAPTDLPPSANTNETGSNALNLGQAYDSYVRVAGNTAAMSADYQWSDLTCDAAGTAGDAVFRFDLSSATRVAVDSSGSVFDTVLALYSASPGLPPSYTAIANTNDNDDSANALGQVFNQIRAVSGDTSAGGLNADYNAAQIGCNADTASNDVVHSFSLSSNARVRISTEGSAFDTVLGLFSGSASPITLGSVANTNETQPTTYDAGTLNNRSLSLTGSTTSMVANYTGTLVGCNADSASPDAVFKFHLDTPTNVRLDTATTGWDTVLALYNQSTIDPNTYVTATNTNETYASATDLGTVDGKVTVVSSGTTSSMVADYGTTEVSCSNSSSARDAVYRFHLDNNRRVRVDLGGSSFDTTLALHRSAPSETSTALPSNINDTLATAFDVGTINNTSFQRTGNNGALAHNYNIGCTADTAVRDSVFAFTLSAPTEVRIDTVGTGFDTVLGLYPTTIVTPPTTVNVGTSHGTRTTAHNMGVLDGASYSFTGNTAGAGASWTDYDCGSDSGAEDSFFRFTLNSTRTVTISAAGSSYDTVLALYKYTNMALTTWADETCHHNNSGDEIITRSLSAGTYFVVVKGDRSDDEGPYALSVRDNAAPAANEITCDDDSGGSSTSQITRSLAAGTYHVVVSGGSAGASGAYTIRFRDKTYWDGFGALECDDDDGSGNTSMIERDLTAGDYWFIIKGRNSGDRGAYALTVSDVNNPPAPVTALACNDDGGSSGTSLITQTALAAGDYWVVLKGDASTDKGSYTLNLIDTSATVSSTVVQCDDDSGEAPNSAVIERDLTAGTYQVVVKGDAASDQGAYRLSVRDVTSRPFNRIACNDDYGSGTTSYLEQDLAAGSYYVTLKGSGSTSTSGAYSLSVRDTTRRPTTSLYCNDNGSTYNTSKITQTLNAGAYYVSLKGKSATQSGNYQLSVGGGSTHTATYAPPTWASTLAAVQDTGVHVISILSCHDDPSYGDDDGDCVEARAQAVSLANASDAIGENLQPLVFDIDGDGSGISGSVVDAVSQLANYLEMDVQVRILFDPDANPGFIVGVQAIDETGDNCNGLIGIEHQNCLPGATPRFLLSFQNPTAPNNVPLNPNDPNGGYNFRAELIGDDQFIVDQIPIYIIPQDLDGMGPPEPEYYPEGEYWQDSGSPGCTGNLAPDWRDLSWNGDVYANTSVTFSACTATTPAGLETCTPLQITKITGGGDCVTSADCAVGYCDTDIGVCQIARASSCTDSAQCASNAYCDTALQLCTYSSQPVYIGSALAFGTNHQQYIRVLIDLAATKPFEAPPVLHSWEMTYQCDSIN